MSGEDPKRLLDQIAADGRDDLDLGRMLSAGKSEGPSDAQMLSLATKIGILGGLGGAGAAGAIGGGGGGGGAAAGGGGAGAAKVAVGVTAAKTGLAIKIGGAVIVASAVTGSAVVVSQKVAAPTHETHATTATGIVGTVSSPSPSTVNAQPTTNIVPLEEPSAAPSSSTTTAAHVRPKTSASAEGPEAEVRLLERAQDALRSRPAEALALADDHAKRFPRGMLVQEREVIAIEALVKLGRTSEARARAARFKSQFPGSSHTRRIETIVGSADDSP